MKKLFNALSLVLMLSMLLTTSVIADVIWTDGDGLEPINNNDVAFGEVCAGITYEKDALIIVRRQGNVNTGDVFANSALVTVIISGYSGSGLNPKMSDTLSETQIQLPENWVAQSTGTQSDYVVAKVKLNTNVLGAFSGSVSFSASGTGYSVTTLTVGRSMAVTATVVDCGEPELITPTLVITNSPVTYNGLPQAALIEARDGETVEVVE